MDKSNVSSETKTCPVCGVEFETDSSATSGYKLCQLHQQQFEEGYLHLVVANPKDKNSSLIKIEEACCTGEIITVKRDVLAKVINKNIDPNLPFVYIEPEAAQLIKEMAGITPDTTENKNLT